MKRTKESGADYSDSQIRMPEKLDKEDTLDGVPPELIQRKVYKDGWIEGGPYLDVEGPRSRQIQSAMIPDKPGKKKRGMFRPNRLSRNTGPGRGRRHSKNLKQGKSEEEIYPGFALIGRAPTLLRSHWSRAS